MTIARVAVDFGLVVLIWLVQLIIYPGFAYYSPAELALWHPRYTNLITLIVGPLMLAQLGLYAWALHSRFDLLTFLGAGLVVVTWVSTAVQAIPLHNQISAGLDVAVAVTNLVRVNWVRTLAWTVLFGLDLLALYGRSTHR